VVTGRAHDGGRCRCAWCVAAAELQWPDVAKEEEDSKVSTGGGERGGATRGAGAELQVLGGGRRQGHARAAEKHGSSGTRGGRQRIQL
jgi:hypothetical protein